VVDACARLKGGKLAKEKLKDQLQKIAAKRTGGEKTDEILGRDGSGPEGLPHSIIVTAEGIEGDAPVVPSTQGNEVEVRQEEPSDEQEPALPTLALKKIKSASKSKVVKVSPPRGAKPASAKQMTLAFDKRSGKTGKKPGKKHGGKKTKK
jgi:DNA topoisomerase-6 subunit B